MLSRLERMRVRSRARAMDRLRRGKSAAAAERRRFPHHAKRGAASVAEPLVIGVVLVEAHHAPLGAMVEFSERHLFAGTHGFTVFTAGIGGA